jgi:hypothetical protein
VAPVAGAALLGDGSTKMPLDPVVATLPSDEMMTSHLELVILQAGADSGCFEFCWHVEKGRVG